MADTTLPRASVVAFEESCKCYKAGAYRAALLFAYLGWGLCLRARILNATLPASFPAGLFQQIQADLKVEEKWDAVVFDSTQTKTAPRVIFDVSDDLRHQVRYWKDRRNDCAHWKDNEIAYAHVEALWMFIQSNLGRFVPNGSIESLLQQLERHFDPDFTVPGADVSPLAQLVPSSVPVANLPDFFAQVDDCLSVSFGVLKLPRYEEVATFLGALIDVGNAAVNAEVVVFLAADLDRLVAFLRAHPAKVLLWAGQAALIRSLWREYLFKIGRSELPLFASLLRNQLIPAAEVAEAVQHVAPRLLGVVPSADDLAVLEQSGLIEEVRRITFAEDRIDSFGWGNANANLIAWYVQTHPVTDQIAQSLASTFSKPNYPYKVRDRLVEMLFLYPAKKEELETKLLQLGLAMPAVLS